MKRLYSMWAVFSFMPIFCGIPSAAAAEVKYVYDKAGRLVRSLVEKSIVSNRRHKMIWHADDDDGRSLPAGVYFVILRVGDSVVTEEVMLLD